jgi:hypothetical protein
MRRSLLPLALLLGCPGGPAADRFEAAQLGLAVDFVCPGDPSGVCDFSDEAELRVGAAAVVITPDHWEDWVDEDGNYEFQSAIDTFFDCGQDRLCDGDPGYPGPDEGEGNGVFDALWLAGFGNARAMNGVADDLWARATVLEQGNTSIGVVALDVVGYFHDEVLQIRELAAAELGLDWVIVQSTHVHEAPDTMGQWGRDTFRSGVDVQWMAEIQLAVLDALRLAQADAVPADVFAGQVTIDDSDWDGTGINNVNIDTREPHITDPHVSTVRFAVAGTNETIATWVNLANHPEAAAADNLLVTSDFAHTLRTTLEEGAATGPDGALAGLGGVAILHQGALGGMQTPLRCDTIDLDGTVYDEHSIDKAYAVGRVYGYHALQAVAADEQVLEPDLSVRAKQFFLRVENEVFWVALNAGIFARTGHNYDEDELIGRNNTPDLRTEVNLLQIGDVAALMVPGELLPELWIGGYYGEWTGPLQELVDDPERTDVALAPDGPYLADLMPGRLNMLFGLANDEIGYLVPSWNYVLHPTNEWFDEADGDHYEETNSVGPDATPDVVGHATELIAWEPPQD